MDKLDIYRWPKEPAKDLEQPKAAYDLLWPGPQLLEISLNKIINLRMLLALNGLRHHSGSRLFTVLS